MTRLILLVDINRCLLLVLSLDTSPKTPLTMEDESWDSHWPGVADWQWLVKLRSNLSELVKTGPWNSWEIVMLVVETDIVGEEVQWAVVREGFWWWRTIERSVFWGGLNIFIKDVVL